MDLEEKLIERNKQKREKIEKFTKELESSPYNILLSPILEQVDNNLYEKEQYQLEILKTYQLIVNENKEFQPEVKEILKTIFNHAKDYIKNKVMIDYGI